MPKEIQEELDSYISSIDGSDTTDTSDTGVTDDNNADDGGNNGNGQDQQSIPGVDADVTPTEQSAQNKNKDQNPQGTSQNNNQKKDKQQGKGDQNGNKKSLRPLGDGVFADEQGNIVDDKGTIVAQRGFAARMYNENRRMKHTLDDRTNQLNQLAQRVGEFDALSRAAKTYNLEPQEMAQAIDLAGRMKRGDHLGVAKEVIALITAQGYNVTDLLGSEVGDTIEMRAIRQMMDERLAPITNREREAERIRQAETTGRQNYERFVSENEFADVHANAIAAVAQKHGLTPQQAYNQVRAFAIQNGLDFTQPLGPQINARMQEQQTQQRQQPAPHNGNRPKPMPNGASTRQNGVSPPVIMADPDDDWGSIIKRVQQGVGLN